MSPLDDTDRRILLALDGDPQFRSRCWRRDCVSPAAPCTRGWRGSPNGSASRQQRPCPPRSAGPRCRRLDPGELDQHQIVAAIDALRKVPEVLECFAPAGDTDLLLRVVAKSPDVLYRVAEVVRLCPGILRTSTSLFLREVIPYRVSELLAAD